MAMTSPLATSGGPEKPDPLSLPATPIPAPPSIWGLWGRASWWIARTPWVVWTIVFIDLSAALAGLILWYGRDVLAAPPYLWPFVPDSPLSAALGGAALWAIHRRGRADLLGLLAVMGLIKYGLWADWYWFVPSLHGFAYTFEGIHLSISHFGMVLQGLALLPLIAPRLPQTLLVIMWYLANDVVDYRLGYYPRIPYPQFYTDVRDFALATTAVLSTIWLVLTALRWFRRPKDEAPPTAYPRAG